MADVGFALAQAFVRIRPDATGFRASATAQIQSALAGVQGNVKITADSDLAVTKITELRAYLDALTDRAWNMAVGVDDKEFQLAMDGIFTQLRTLSRTTANPNISLEGIARAQTQLLALDVQMDALDAKSADTSKIFTGWLSTAIPLFGGLLPGMLGSVGAIHLLTDGVIEFLAVIIPAGVALGVFAAVGTDEVTLLVQQFQTMSTVGRAMNQNLLPLSGAFVKMEAAANPQVMVLLGDALQVAGEKASGMAVFAKQAGAAVDQLASRATLAIKGSGFSQFLANAVPDLEKLGTVVGNVFGIVGNLLKSTAGVAQVLLQAFVDLTGALEAITANPIVQWLLRLADGLHGALIYIGLLGTGLLLLGRPLGSLAGALAGVSSTVDDSAGVLAKAKAGWTQLGQSLPLIVNPAKGAGTAVEDAGDLAEEASGNTGLLSKAMGVLGGSFGWVGLAVAGAAGLGLLIYALVNAKSATQQWADNLQNAISAQTTFGGISKETVAAVEKTGTALANAQSKLKEIGNTEQVVAGRAGEMNSAATAQAGIVNTLTQAHQKYLTELGTENARIIQLTHLFGTAGVAQGLMNQAGISAVDIATASNSKWRQDVQTLVSLESAVKATADAAGTAGNNERVLNYELSDQYTAVTKLNSGWDTYIGLVTGSQNAFDTVEQGFTAMNQNGETFTSTLGKLSASATYVASNIDALTPSGIALNQAFSQQVTNFNALFDSWRTSGLATNTLNTGIKAAIATLLPMAAGSKEATAQLSALASEAGYSGPVDFRSLQTWIGNVSNATGILKNTTDEATFSETQLTGAFQAQGNIIAQKLVSNINAAILAYDGVYAAATKYGKAIAQTGQDSDATRTARTALINDLVKAGNAANQSNAQIAAMIAKVLQIPSSAAVKLVMNAEGNYSISGTSRITHASGYRVPGYGGGDTHPALLEGGESVVPKHLTPMVAPFLKSHGVPGFQSGIVNYGNQAIYGAYAGSAYNAFTQTSIVELINSMRSALYAAERAALAAAQAAGAVGLRAYDSGGFLPPGLSMAYNGTGRPEPVGAAAAGGASTVVQLEWVGTDAGIFSALRNGIRVRGGLTRALGP